MIKFLYRYDKFQPLVDFWQTLLTSPEELSDAVSKYHPLAKEEFYRIRLTEHVC